MLKLLKLGGAKKGTEHNPTNEHELTELVQEGVQLELALFAMDKVMDGQIDQAEALLNESSSVFHKVARGVLYFLEALAGFEAESVKKAVNALSVSEQAAAKARSTAVERGLRTSSFRPGSEYEMMHVESSLLMSVSMLLSESVLDAVKALYRLRKTYFELDDLRKHVEATRQCSTAEFAAVYEKPEMLSQFRKAYTQRVKDEKLEAAKEGYESDASSRTVVDVSSVYPQTSMDELIMSGVEACSGLIQLVISSVPPNMTRLLSIVGFKGDRSSALKMLWNVTGEYTNIHSSLALTALLMFFDGPFQYSDIQLSPEEERVIDEKYAQKGDITTKTTATMTPGELHETEERLRSALLRTRKHYPRGVLWLLQWGRTVARSDLAQGIKILESDECGPCQMVQIEGLLVFDKVNMMLSLQLWEEASAEYIRLLELSTWSHALYYYMAAACELELYREKYGTEAAKPHKEKIAKYLTISVKKVGGRTLMGKTMPFDHFVVRKVNEIQATAKRLNIDVADAIGTSLVLEAGYFWNIQSRMPQPLIGKALESLAFSANPDLPLKENADNEFTRELLTAIYLRLDNQVDKGFALLEKLLPKVITPSGPGVPHKVAYHKQHEPWAGPVVLYERAVYEWQLNGAKNSKQVREWLKLLGGWDEDYELSTRINMRLTAANDRLDIYRM